MTFFNNDHGFSAGQPGVPWGAILPDFPPMKPLCRSLRCVALVAGGTALLSGCATRPMTDGLGIEFVRIPAGGFDMGSAESVAALEAAILRLLVDPDLRRTLAKAGSQTIERRFSIERWIDALVDVYRDAIEVAA